MQTVNPTNVEDRLYRVGHIYRDTAKPDRDDDQFLRWLNTPKNGSLRGSGMANSPGIRPVRFIKGDLSPLPAFIVLVTFPSGPSHNPWEDLVDHESARIVYWGDAKHDSRRAVADFQGNRALAETWNAILDRRHPFVPPILHFSKPRSGEVIFNGLCVLEQLELTWFHEKSGPVKNYCCHLGILDAESVDSRWLRARVAAAGAADLDTLAPTAWKAYQAGRVERMDVWKSLVRTRAEQLPSGPAEAQLIETLHALSPREFESAVVAIFKGWSTVTHTITPTRHVRDSGFDFFGRFVLPPPLSYKIDFLGEAKKYALTQGVGPGDVSRLVARLGRGQYGVFVTTSYFTEAAQREVLADGYPVALIAAVDLVRWCRELKLTTKTGVDPAWITAVKTAVPAHHAAVKPRIKSP